MIKTRKIDFVKLILTIVFIVFASIFIIQLILKLTSHSPGETQMLFAALVAIVAYLFIMSYKLGTFAGEVREFMKTSKNTFNKMGTDISDMKKDMVELKSEITYVKKDIRKIENNLSS